MMWGWECRAKLVKQVPAKPTKSRGPVSCALKCPGPNHYETPEIFCGKGYSLIKRAPAFTFGHRTPYCQSKPPILKSAPLLDTSGFGRKGNYKIKHGVVSPRIKPPDENMKGPGPGIYKPRNEIMYKRPPVYTMRPAAKPPYQPWDQWTPSPNMYWPRMPGKKSFPAFTFGSTVKELSTQIYPSPGDHEPKFEYVQKNKPAYSFGAPYRSLKPAKVPPPNTYCEKKFMYPKRTIPAPSFGIRHTRYLGKQQEYLKSSKLDIVIPGEI
ncbi:uncharacterized protein LOC126768460 [Nymphalis io]|uniref:uncharacterized protein LOC126768460 n=1 Tax=Inachis io TaxID=171585 RepID=UPI002169B1FD|nr:uncharacterized protein LOC126768460 [Nymphalis io]